ncbi:hypothetical protein A3Q56_02063 [Intoshia linei]|uniref:Uncharacterized protein n=1 Tax=Intoshia linei TaxID=1819745 RepID=A0A177B7H8_9BILA|nr:hypothetical protein A3Q56_02063 [Intoshia linei]
MILERQITLDFYRKNVTESEILINDIINLNETVCYAMLNNIENFTNQTIEIETSLILAKIETINPTLKNYVYRKYKFYGNISLSLGSNLEPFHINKFIIIDHYNTVEKLIKYDKLKFIIPPDDIKKFLF